MMSLFRKEREDLEDQLDDEAIKSFDRMKEDFEHIIEENFQSREIEFQKEIQMKANLNEDDVDKLMRIHEQQMFDIEGNL